MMRFPLAVFTALALLCLPAASHDPYTDWRNRAGNDCCHGQDCAPVKPEDVDESGPELMVRVRGTWCPVKDHMRLSRGKSPDWSTVHACIRKSIADPCSALLCFAGRPQF